MWVFCFGWQMKSLSCHSKQQQKNLWTHWNPLIKWLLKTWSGTSGKLRGSSCIYRVSCMFGDGETFLILYSRHFRARIGGYVFFSCIRFNRIMDLKWFVKVCTLTFNMDGIDKNMAFSNFFPCCCWLLSFFFCLIVSFGSNGLFRISLWAHEKPNEKLSDFHVE